MVNVRMKKCDHSGCTKQPSYGNLGGKAELCAEHANDGMVNVRHKTCCHIGCTKQASYGAAGSVSRKACAQHATEGMMNLSNGRHRGAKGVAVVPEVGIHQQRVAQLTVWATATSGGKALLDRHGGEGLP